MGNFGKFSKFSGFVAKMLGSEKLERPSTQVQYFSNLQITR